MTGTPALFAQLRAAPLEALRMVIVYGCALALIAAGTGFPA